VTLARGLDAAAAERMSAELNQHGIATSKSSDGSAGARYQIVIGPDAVEAALEALTASHTTLGSSDEPALDDGPLIESPSAQQQRMGRLLALDLARSIELLPGVLRARVHLTLPSTDTSLADLSAADAINAPSAAVLLLRAASAHEAHGLHDVHGADTVVESIRGLVTGAVPKMTPQAVSIVETVEPDSQVACPRLARIGPIGVAQASARTLKLWLGVGLSVHMLLAAIVLGVLTRQRRSARAQPPTAP